MKVTLIQMDIVWEDAAANRQTAEHLILSAEKSDIYVLPEMWNTGVTAEPQSVAEDEDGETLLWMKRMSRELDAAVVGGVAVRLQDGTYRNRLYFVKPDGSVDCYDKHHLFTYGGEAIHFVPGEERVTVEWRGLLFRLCICYDLRFPLWVRNTDDYDVLICSASWPAVRTHAWNILTQARAIENQCYVLGVNRIGSDPVCQYIGGTTIVDPYGMPTTCPGGETTVLTKTLDIKRLKSFREKFPVLKETDVVCRVFSAADSADGDEG